jgi:acyl-coenzyme A synthetase/AMP-(fatty) acid ligase
MLYVVLIYNTVIAHSHILVVGGTPLLPVYSGEIQARCLGMAVKIFDAAQIDPVEIACPGIPGEMVCTQPFPSQPIQFFGPGGMDRYRSSYFERYGNGIWCQGDFIQIIEETQGIVMLGRSYVFAALTGMKLANVGLAMVYSILRECDSARQTSILLPMECWKSQTPFALASDEKATLMNRCYCLLR